MLAIVNSETYLCSTITSNTSHHVPRHQECDTSVVVLSQLLNLAPDRERQGDYMSVALQLVPGIRGSSLVSIARAHVWLSYC
jgi:hypothetical protein